MDLSSVRRSLAPVLAFLCVAFAPFDAALAAPKKAAPAPQISAFEMEPVDKVAAGTELFFRVQGTAGGRATVRVGGVTRTLVLQEVDDGVYEGAYVVRPNDKANANSTASATLRRSNRSTTVTMGRLAAPQVAQAQAQPVQRPPLQIQRFTVAPITAIEPGAELKFVLLGTPGAGAVFTIEGVAQDVPMREVSPGRYEGTYTIKRMDRITTGVPVLAALWAQGQPTVRTTLQGQSLLADARPPTIRNVHPRDGETVAAAGQVSVSGTFDDQRGVGVDPKSVKLVVGGRDVTASSTITKDYFTYRAELPPGNYAADVQAKDMAGNAVRQAWSFTVAPGGGTASGTGIPLEILSHMQNAGVPPGRVEVRGRTAPNATVEVNVVGLAGVAGFVGVQQRLHSERLTADGGGNFRFDFQPQMQVPGMRYEIEVKASQGNNQKDTKLVLFQTRA